VTQSTVSARIKTLEDRLGKVLFVRSKAGASLTPAGVQFQRHAQAMVRVWEHARLEIALPEGYRVALNVGSQHSLWDGFLIKWLADLRRKSPTIAVRAQLGFSADLMQATTDGVLDLAVMYTPQSRPGFEVEMLFEDQLILVSSVEPKDEQVPPDNYVMIDWGPEFRADHALNFPEITVPGTYLQLGSLSLQYLIETRSAGYVPKRLVAAQLAAGDMHWLKKAPTFYYSAYAVYPSDNNEEFAALVLDGLRSHSRAMAQL
jgi:DNA-binding transcriptional LysR family regulator